MPNNNIYIQYSTATEKTGKALQAALDITGGMIKPTSRDITTVIGWGAKEKPNSVYSNTTIFNHPAKIAVNRNKVGALAILKDGRVNVAPFADATNITSLATLTSSGLRLPVIGRTKYHQGGKGFWLCPTITQVLEAKEAGANYFQEFIEIDKEYRVHVFNGNVIHAVVKTKRTPKEFEDAFIEDEFERQKALAESNGDSFDEATIRMVIRRQAKNATAGGPSSIIRSNKLGWKFVPVPLANLPDSVIVETKKAISALGLTFGAVDCCIPKDSNDCFIIEVNSGPGLEGTTFDRYVESFKTLLFPKIKLSAKKTVVTPTAETVSTISESAPSLGTNVAAMEVNTALLQAISGIVEATNNLNATAGAMLKIVNESKPATTRKKTKSS